MHQYPATVVTSLYDIGRGRMNGKFVYRPFEDYLSWMKNLLLMNCPMVIYTSKSNYSYIIENRPKLYPTKIVIRELENLRAYKYREILDETIKKMKLMGYKHDHYDICPEFVTPDYNIVIYSKLDFLKESSEENIFNTEYFIWLDARSFRNSLQFNPEIIWPDKYKIKCLGNKFLLCDRAVEKPLLKLDTNEVESEKIKFMRGHNNFVYAYILGGIKSTINKVWNLFWKEINTLLNMGVCNNEQHILYILSLENKDLFFKWKQIHYDNIEYPTRHLMIPSELATGNYISYGYPINFKLKIYAVATVNILEQQYEKWVNTAKYYGYDYEILGRNSKWSGFETKIKLVRDSLETCKHPYVAVVDCTDVFFSGPSEELLDKYITFYDNCGKYVLSGGETSMFYKKGKHKDNIIRDYFEKIKKSRQKFPNGGFVIGRQSDVFKYYDKILDYKDDQASLYDYFYENKINNIDYDTHLVANIIKKPESLTNFEFDPVLNRYKNNVNGSYPVVLHFPGSNFYYMNRFYTDVKPKHTLAIKDKLYFNYNYQSDNFYGIWFFIVTIFVIVLFASALYFI